MTQTKSSTRQIGGLSARLVDALPEGAAPRLLCVLCHGYGAPEDDLASIGGELIRASRAVASQVRFIFPAAPLSLGGYYGSEARAWWPLDMEALDDAIRRGTFLDRTDEVPEQLSDARTLLTDLIQAQLAELGLGVDRLVLGGFSQGAMLATDVSLRLASNPALLGIFSGTLINAAEWRSLAAARRGTAVVQSHGRQDPLLPFAAAEQLRDLLESSGLAVEFIPFDGPHTIPIESLVAFLRAIEGALAHPWPHS